MAALDEQYEGEDEPRMDDARDEVEPEETQPPDDDEVEQDNYANTDDKEEA